MSAINEFRDNINGSIKRISTGLKLRIFGHNNERLDFVMDSFYKLSPQQKNAVVATAGGGVLLFVISAIYLYFAQVKQLEKELSDTFVALQVLKSRKIDDTIEEKRFNKLTEVVIKKTKSIKFKPFFEKVARENNVNFRGLNEKTVDMSTENPMSEKLKEVYVEMQLPKISIPKLLDFLGDIEKSRKYLRVYDLKITGLYGNKLYFDTNIVVRGYEAK